MMAWPGMGLQHFANWAANPLAPSTRSNLARVASSTWRTMGAGFCGCCGIGCSDLPRSGAGSSSPISRSFDRIRIRARPVTTDAEGRFALAGVAGSWIDLVVVADGYEPLVERVRAGAPLRLRVTASGELGGAELILIEEERKIGHNAGDWSNPKTGTLKFRCP